MLRSGMKWSWVTACSLGFRVLGFGGFGAFGFGVFGFEVLEFRCGYRVL